MAPPRTNTPSRRRPSQSTKAGPQPEAETEAESSAPRAKTPHRRHHNQVTQTEPEAEIENTETVSSRALTAWHNRRPSRSSEADAEPKPENQVQKPAQPTIPIETPPGPHKWALYFANLDSTPSNNGLLGFPLHCFLASILGFSISIALEVSACMLIGAMDWWRGRGGTC